MRHRLATIATFWSPIEANLAKNCLEGAGIKAFLADEQAAGMMWHMANAMRGIKLQVEDRDVEEAIAVLAEDLSADLLVDGEAADPAMPSNEDAQPEKLGGTDEDDRQWELTPREQNAQRALKSAVLGLLFLPLELYTFWLLLKVLASHERLGAAQRRRAIVAAIINVPFIIGGWLLLKANVSR